MGGKELAGAFAQPPSGSVRSVRVRSLPMLEIAIAFLVTRRRAALALCPFIWAGDIARVTQAGCVVFLSYKFDSYSPVEDALKNPTLKSA